MKLGKTERVLGYECQWIRLDPRDALRFAQRVCSEISTGPDPARARRSTRSGRCSSSTRFTDLRIGPQVARADLKSIFRRAAQVAHRRAAARRGRQRGHRLDGRQPPSRLPPGGRAQAHAARARAAGHADRAHRRRSPPCPCSSSPCRTRRSVEATNEDGATAFFVAPDGRALVTVLGEVPLATAQQVARSVARRP